MKGVLLKYILTQNENFNMNSNVVCMSTHNPS